MKSKRIGIAVLLCVVAACGMQADAPPAEPKAIAEKVKGL